MMFNLKCEDHPKYEALRKPRKNCEACWAIYFMVTDGSYVFQNDLSVLDNVNVKSNS
jgi:hypothetical protein